jgi:hypothetical protein
MAAFVNRQWGRYVSVCGYRRLKRGRWERVRPHLRVWPGDAGQEWTYVQV